MISKIGDRYKFKFAHNDEYHIWEICDVGKAVIVESTSHKKVGDTSNFRLVIPSYYEYLGNFNKDSNFNELYNLMNS